MQLSLLRNPALAGTSYTSVVDIAMKSPWCWRMRREDSNSCTSYSNTDSDQVSFLLTMMFAAQLAFVSLQLNPVMMKPVAVVCSEMMLEAWHAIYQEHSASLHVPHMYWPFMAQGSVETVNGLIVLKPRWYSPRCEGHSYVYQRFNNCTESSLYQLDQF